jgi:Ca2+-binding EF-hand superfamily protein
MSERGFIVIPSFVSKVQELAQQTPQEAQLHRFATSVGRQGINLRNVLSTFESNQQQGKLDRSQFKKALRQLSLGLSDAEIDLLFSSAETSTEILDT